MYIIYVCSTEVPSEFRLPTENLRIDVRNHNIEHNDINGKCYLL